MASPFLKVNMINEKFFLIIWFWLVALVFIGISNFCIWAYRVLMLRGAEDFILYQLVNSPSIQFLSQTFPLFSKFPAYVRFLLDIPLASSFGVASAVMG